MSGKKGMKHYPDSLKEQIVQDYKQGYSIKELHRKYGISRWSIHCWCGLSEKVNRCHATPLHKGRPRKNPENQEQLIRRLQMENELLRNFLSLVGRK
jgi:transposase-like protein